MKVLMAVLLVVFVALATSPAAHPARASTAPANPVLVLPLRTPDSPALALFLRDKASLDRAASFWRAASRGAATFGYTYLPTTTLGAYTKATVCRGALWERFARVALTRPAAVGQKFSAVVIVIGQAAGCPVSAYTVTSGGTRIVLLSAAQLRTGWSVAAHELGHSLGLAHSHAATLTAPGEQPAYQSEYGDSWSIMGSGGELAAPPAPMQAALGWLRPRPLVPGQASNLRPLSAGDALVWDRGGGSRLWIELRDDGPAPGVVLHAETGTQSGYAQSWLVTPVPLWPGAVWTDPFTGVSLEVRVGAVALRGDLP